MSNPRHITTLNDVAAATGRRDQGRTLLVDYLDWKYRKSGGG
jgi:hypothetical protein